MRIKANCGSCGATGLYKGFAEPPGVAVICETCGGKGYVMKEMDQVAPAHHFTGRRQKSDVKRIHWSRGSFVDTGVGPTKHSVSYKEFLEGKRPQKENP